MFTNEDEHEEQQPIVPDRVYCNTCEQEVETLDYELCDDCMNPDCPYGFSLPFEEDPLPLRFED